MLVFNLCGVGFVIRVTGWEDHWCILQGSVEWGACFKVSEQS